MSNSALISFKLDPAHYAVVKALADGQGVSLSAFVRETVVEALDLEGKLDVLAVALANLALEDEADALAEAVYG